MKKPLEDVLGIPPSLPTLYPLPRATEAVGVVGGDAGKEHQQSVISWGIVAGLKVSENCAFAARVHFVR